MCDRVRSRSSFACAGAAAMAAPVPISAKLYNISILAHPPHAILSFPPALNKNMNINMNLTIVISDVFDYNN